MKVLGIDISASSGRFIAIDYGDGFSAKELYRFPTGQEEENGHLVWHFHRMWEEIKVGLKRSFELEKDISAIGVDTFGVDYGRLDEEDRLIGDVYGYRDPRCARAMESFLKERSYDEVYFETGIQRLPFNTLFQLYDDFLNGREYASILLLPDLINFLLTGKKFTEYTDLSTGALFNPIKGEVSESLCEAIGFDSKKLSPIIYPSQKVGDLKSELCEELGIPSVPVFATGSHDTASAVASIDLDENTAYLSSGTWSLLGVELDKPLINEETKQANFTNELGVGGRVRFLKNIMGLFIIQQLKADFDKEDPTLTYGVLSKEAEEAPCRFLIDVNSQEFAQPGNMLAKILANLKENGVNTENLTRGEIARGVYESMCVAYKKEWDNLESLIGHKLNRLVIVGGGSNSDLLNRRIAETLNVEVVTGQAEATIYGNALAVMLGLGVFSSLDEARKALAKCTSSRIYKAKA